jgi:hypothetical protein
LALLCSSHDSSLEPPLDCQVPERKCAVTPKFVLPSGLCNDFKSAPTWKWVGSGSEPVNVKEMRDAWHKNSSVYRREYPSVWLPPTKMNWWNKDSPAVFSCSAIVRCGTCTGSLVSLVKLVWNSRHVGVAQAEVLEEVSLITFKQLMLTISYTRCAISVLLFTEAILVNTGQWDL